MIGVKVQRLFELVLMSVSVATHMFPTTHIKALSSCNQIVRYFLHRSEETDKMIRLDVVFFRCLFQSELFVNNFANVDKNPMPMC